MLRKALLLAVCVGVAWVAVAAQPAQPAPAEQVIRAEKVESQPVDTTLLTGWTGGEPAAVGVGIDRDGAVTAAFTSTDGNDGSLWVSDRSAAGGWEEAIELASGVDASSADFGESRSGAAVLAWDSTTVEGETRLMVSVRSTSQASWSTPRALASGSSSGPGHQAAVGVSNAGVATVAYTRDSGDGPVAVTRQFTAGAWTGAIEHSDVPARQLDLAVGTSGYATVAWTQDSSDGLDLYARRFVAAAGGWQPATKVSPRLAANGMTSLSVNSSGASAMTYDTVDGSRDRSTYFARTNNDSSSPVCEPDCANNWRSNLITSRDGDDAIPSAVTIDWSADVGQATVLWATGPSEGRPRIRAMQERGDSFSLASDVSPTGDIDQLAAVSDGTYRTFATWVTHSADGDILHSRGLATPNDQPKPDPQLTELGPASGDAVSALARYGPGVVVWTDTTVQPAVLRSASVPVFTPGFYDVDAEMVAPEQDFSSSVLVRGRWSAASTSPTYDVRTRQASVRRPFGSYVIWQQRTPANSAQFQSDRGRTVCFSSRSRSGESATASAGPWSRERCTTVALDDTALAGTGWKRESYDPFYGDSRLATRKRGATLVVRDVRARSIALMTSRRAGNGRIAVTLGGAALGTVRMSGAHAHRVVIPVARFDRLRSGTLRLTAVDAKPVNIDGVFISRR